MPGGAHASRRPATVAETDGSTEILAGVSRETRAVLELYVDELRRWQRVKNLVGRSTLDDVWNRHVADSLQLLPLATGSVWVDLGSGAGFPGLILAIARPDLRVHLVESDGRKAAFLRHAARLCAAHVEVWAERVDVALASIVPAPDVVVSRAMAALPELLSLAEGLLTNGAIGLFPKGESYGAELTAAAESWRFTVEAVPSRTDPGGRILRISALSRRERSATGESS